MVNIFSGSPRFLRASRGIPGVWPRLARAPGLVPCNCCMTCVSVRLRATRWRCPHACGPALGTLQTWWSGKSPKKMEVSKKGKSSSSMERLSIQCLITYFGWLPLDLGNHLFQIQRFRMSTPIFDDFWTSNLRILRWSCQHMEATHALWPPPSFKKTPPFDILGIRPGQQLWFSVCFQGNTQYPLVN